MNPFELFKNMQSVQQQMQNMQAKLAHITATGSSGGGMVEVSVNGKMEVLSIKISPEAVDPEDIPTLEVLVAGAFNAAMQNIQEQLKSEASSLTGGLNLPTDFPGMS
ncbi:MAG: YbaB/EbfC family nucleoid-associated protein [Sphaerochaetaceae bacterium]|jgi:DNA-binding YbaB/EbfC family protein|nr:YbaB/EbfC family nucleoid-associated protein [Sphaerochaetaceae bacterium]NLO59546.1 YbaB/EbfC family nucleoid-associated protein [Spirochaetales bacterium]MDD2405671.1 YbaB/EbfC family nucleoid-associated protein [Sphaerochaetaceae bacterium]MDD4258413.1 YbaB/EbfC family nucleoid-associated protein [Sphaerochaetaceae bacterium]MDD4762256.1 YbaB/EbfC family nucleoid-associated protein [Sphaerochaetaceae bacterium]